MIPDDAWPAGDRLEWSDDETRTHHDFLNESTRDYTDEENAAADEREAVKAERDSHAALTDQARAFLALNSPTDSQVRDQLRALTRLLLGE